jgi:hypothetical protein
VGLGGDKGTMSYNGHRNWNHWNVSLWIGNDEGLYHLARECKRRAKTVRNAAEDMLQLLNDAGINKTPDGAPYTKSAIRAAMSGL